MATTVTLNINGVNRSVTVTDVNMKLLWVLRDMLGLTGTKYGCGIQQCSACAVLLDGQNDYACALAVSDVIGKKVTTIEGLAGADPSSKVAADANYVKAAAAWQQYQVPQCGYCQSGMLVRCVGAMKAGHHGSQILPEMPNICACGTYARIKQAVTNL
jgi:isoquinoline 1-oxidoreductase alpha subunit